MLVGHSLKTNEVTRLIGEVHGLHTLTTAVGDTIDWLTILVVEVGTLTKALLGNHEYRLLATLLYTNHANHAILTILVELDSTYTRCGTTHWANGILWEANHLTIVGSYQHLAIAVGECHANQAVTLTQTKSNDTVGAWTAVGFKRGLLHQTVLGSEDEVVVLHILHIVEVLHVDKRANLVALLDVDHILQCTTL